MSAAAAQIRHIVPRVSQAPALLAAKAHSDEPGLGPGRLLWVPFEASTRQPSLERGHVWCALRPATLSGAQTGAPPSDGSGQVLSARSSDIIYLPVWSFRTAAGRELLIDARDGAAIWSNLPADHRAAMLRVLCLLAVGLSVIWLGQSVGYGSGRVVAALLIARARLLGAVVPAIAILLAAWVVQSFVSKAVVPAIEVCMADVLSGRIRRGESPAVVRILALPGPLFFCVIGINLAGQWLMHRWHLPPLLALGTNAVCLVLIGRKAAARMERAEPKINLRDLPEGQVWAERLAFIERLCRLIVGALLFCSLLSTYRTLIIAVGVPVLAGLEENGIEAFLVGLAALRAVVGSGLAPKVRWPMSTSLLLPLVLNPFVPPALVGILQYAAVALTIRWVEQREGGGNELGESALVALRVEAFALGGALLCSAFGTFLLGSSGWTTGDVLGELLGASFALSVPIQSDRARLGPKLGVA